MARNVSERVAAYQHVNQLINELCTQYAGLNEPVSVTAVRMLTLMELRVRIQEEATRLWPTQPARHHA